MTRPRISEIDLNRLAVRGAKVKRQSPVPTAAEVAASESVESELSRPEPAPPSPPPTVDNSIPFASMAASMNAINRQLDETIKHNSRVIDDFRNELAKEQPPKSRPKRLQVVRDRTRLIDHVDILYEGEVS